jgi:hypothetical protein
LNWAENYQPVNELYQTADHPALSPDFCHPERRVKTAGEFGGSGITTWKTRGKYSPSDLAGGGGGRLGEVWFGSFSSTAYSFLMISPNLHDIWAMFFLILSRYEKLVLLMLLRTSGDGYSLLGSKK